MKKPNSRKLLASVIAAAVAMEAAPVFAQLEEVIVTARKRDESIMKVPATTTVFSQDALEQYAINDVKSVADQTPGLNFSNGPLASGVMVSMRGVGSGTSNAMVDQSVALVADGVQLTQGLAFAAATFDLAQVEVLKGPQALFFGKAAPAGVISVTSADPGEEFELIARVGYESEAEEDLAEIIISAPLSDTLGVRLAAQTTDSNGYWTNNAQPQTLPDLSPFGGPPLNLILGNLGAAEVTHKEFPKTERTIARATVVWEPSDKFKARLKYSMSDMETLGYGGEPQLVDCPDGTGSLFAALGISFIGGQTCKADDEVNFSYFNPATTPMAYNGGVPYMDQEQSISMLELNYDLGNGLTVTSVTGQYSLEQSALLNGNLSTQTGSIFGIQSAIDRDDFTQELRLTSDYDGDVNFVVGAFYHSGEVDYTSSLPVNLAYNSLFPILGSPTQLPPVLGLSYHKVDTTARSLFGQVLFKAAPDVEIGVGARWTSEKRDHAATNGLPKLLGLAPINLPIALADPDISSNNLSPELSITYTPSDDLTVFGNIKQAFKSGSFDIGGTPGNGDDKSFDDERIRGGELGVKARLLDGAMALNVSVYNYSYDDLQVESREFDPANGVVGVRTTNAASATIQGMDLDVAYAVPSVAGLTLTGAINWNVSEYDEFNNATCWDGQLQSEGCNIDKDGDGVGDAQSLSGAPLLRAPEWMATFGLDYERSLASGMSMRLGLNANYSDSYSASSTNIPAAYQDSYVKTNASVALSGADNRWTIELIGRNLGDEYTWGNCAPSTYANTFIFGKGPGVEGTGTVAGGPGGKPETACYVERGRSVQARLTVRF